MRITTVNGGIGLAQHGMPIRVVELFAGVGGFREALGRARGYEVIWFNQWEPSIGAQHAYQCYIENYHPGEDLDPTTNRDIGQVPTSVIPDHDLLVGGFPCQDYSVAATLDKSKGIDGQKGVLWWEIKRILAKKRPPYVLLENVDRLLRSPSKQRGRDFAILLACMRNLGYAVEWRVINAADYGFPQKRRRVFLFASHSSSKIGKDIAEQADRPDFLPKRGFFGPAFPVKTETVQERGPMSPNAKLPRGLVYISDSFGFHFLNAGVMVKGRIWTRRLVANGQEPISPMSTILRPCEDDSFFIPKKQIDAAKGWRYHRSAKREIRVAKNGHQYNYAEGAMAFPDPVSQPARTILTGEGGTYPSRSKHAVRDPKTGGIRTLMPEECELLNGFPEGHTSTLPPRWRYFTMGNALVVGVVERMGHRLNDILQAEATPKVAPRKRPTTDHTKKAMIR